MKKLLTLIICFAATTATTIQAQTNSRSVAATDVEMTRSGDSVTVAFTFVAGEKATKATYNLVVTPVLRNRASKVELPGITIQGRRSKVLDLRHELAGRRDGALAAQQNAIFMEPGETMRYTATVHYEEWMRGGKLVLDGVSVGCCSSRKVELGLVADNVLYAEPRFETRIVDTPLNRPTTGEQMAERYSFVAPADELETIERMLRYSDDPAVVDRILAETRDGSISVYFDQGLREIDANFGDNSKNLVELISAVRAIASAKDSKIAAVIIAGFASPEGSVQFNERLAGDRAEVVKEFLVQNTNVDPAMVRVFNGRADWPGLREQVENSNMAEKQRILDIIDHMPVWDGSRNAGRLGELMRLDGGRPYRYMLRNFFPQLRQAAYIKVYYKDNDK